MLEDALDAILCFHAHLSNSVPAVAFGSGGGGTMLLHHGAARLPGLGGRDFNVKPYADICII